MFGGQAIPPGNSPHLRKSGSRSVVFDLGGELGNGAEEGFLHATESDSLKMLPIQLSAAAVIMPSPVLLWRFKVLLFFLWGFVCCKIGWSSVMRMSANLRDLFLYEVFLYYNPLLLVTLAVWFWGSNLWVFSQSTVSYAKIFDLDQSHLTHREIWKVAMWMTIVVPSSMTAYLYLYSHGEAISFADFFVADILTSMSKVFSDMERSVCRMVHRQVATIAWFEADSICGSHSVAIPMVLVLPYLFRLFQCLRQYKDTKEKTSLLNALKYSTAVPVIFLSALKYHVFPDKWTNFYRPLWLFSSVLNSLYSFYWDVTRDWDMSGFTRIFKFNRPSVCSYIIHGRKWVYFWVIGSNLILRCTWTYKLSAHLRHNYLTVFAITALEIFRRFQWVFFRVENEWNKMNAKSTAQLALSEKSTEEEKSKLLASSDHNV
ncbi:SPX and EXS domain-containing protein 1 [Linum grandiflorum]